MATKEKWARKYVLMEVDTRHSSSALGDMLSEAVKAEMGEAGLLRQVVVVDANLNQPGGGRKKKSVRHKIQAR